MQYSEIQERDLGDLISFCVCREVTLGIHRFSTHRRFVAGKKTCETMTFCPHFVLRTYRLAITRESELDSEAWSVRTLGYNVHFLNDEHRTLDESHHWIERTLFSTYYFSFPLGYVLTVLRYRRIPLASPGLIHAHFGDLAG